MKTLSHMRTKSKITRSSCLFWILFNVSAAALYFIVSSTNACAGQVTLGWDKSTEADVVGYKIYYGTASRNYTQSIKITSPNITTVTVLNLTEGKTYYFAATTYTGALLESEYSAEVFTAINSATTTVPAITTTIKATTSSSTSSIRATTTVPKTTTTIKATTSSSTSSIRATTTVPKTTTTTTVITFAWNRAQTFSFQCTQAAVYKFRILARGTPVRSVYPIMECRVDRNTPLRINVNSDQWQTYAFSRTLTKGSHQINISFINDAYRPPEDRNLFISKIEMVGPTGTTPINVLSITAASLQQVVGRPILQDKKCQWLTVYSSQQNHFTPESSSIEITSPEEGANGVTIDSEQSAISAGRFILVPMCVEREASVGQWGILIKSNVNDSAHEETMMADFQVK